MKLTTVMLCVAIIAAAGVLSAQGQQKAGLRRVMGPNFENMNDMLLHILVDEDYGTVSEDAKRIVKHAQLIRRVGPSKDMPDVSYFKNYANFLEAHAMSLGIVADTIQREENAKAERSVHLRPQAAMHYGQIVTMCVSCHNRYRQRSIPVR